MRRFVAVAAGVSVGATWSGRAMDASGMRGVKAVGGALCTSCGVESHPVVRSWRRCGTPIVAPAAAVRTRGLRWARHGRSAATAERHSTPLS